MTLGPLGNATSNRFTSVVAPTCTASPMLSGKRTAPLDARVDRAGPHAPSERLQRRLVPRAGHS